MRFGTLLLDMYCRIRLPFTHPSFFSWRQSTENSKKVDLDLVTASIESSVDLHTSLSKKRVVPGDREEVIIKMSYHRGVTDLLTNLRKFSEYEVSLVNFTHFYCEYSSNFSDYPV